MPSGNDEQFCAVRFPPDMVAHAHDTDCVELLPVVATRVHLFVPLKVEAHFRVSTGGGVTVQGCEDGGGVPVHPLGVAVTVRVCVPFVHALHGPVV